MRQGTPDNPEQTPAGPLTPSRFEDWIKAFEQAWRRGEAPAIADYLADAGEQRHALLVELVHIDLEFRLKADLPARVESYLAEHPGLVGDRSAVLGLLAAELELRRRRGEEVAPTELAARFPDYQDALRDQFAVTLLTRAGRLPPAGRPVTLPAVPGYEIVRELGRGGMGVVYRARDDRLDRPVALKFLPPEYTRDADRLARFLHEAKTASALNHPNICTVHALGEHDGRPFIVMEFIEGRTLQALVGQRHGVAALAPLIAQAARALAAAHAAGVVHRDVKPENVMVRDDGYVKVLDFGLARRLPTLATEAGPADTEPGGFRGTVAYASPEQARGEPAGSASDVFSLGIVLYQLATGAHPFHAESSLGYLYAIVFHAVAPASRLNPEAAALDGLLEAMLQKDARLRPTAAEVAAALRGLAALPSPSGGAAAGRPTVGRAAERAGLRTALAEAEAGRGGVLCVSGEPGIGKTSLVEDFLRELPARGRPYLVARGRCSERLAGAEAYLPVLEAIEGLLRDSAAAARAVQVVAPTWYAQAARTAAAAAPAGSQPAMQREFCALLAEASRLAPVVLFLDDVHWADLPTVDLLTHLGRSGSAMRVLTVLTYRPTELLLGPHPFYRAKLELQAQGVCRELALGFLSRDDVEAYLALAFPGHGFPTDFAGLIHARTEGSPLFMADLLAYLRDRSVIAEQAGRWALARPLPDLSRELPESARGMIQRKLDQLPPDDRRLAAAAAVQGASFDSAVVAEALRRDPAEVEERLQALERVYGLVRLTREHEFPDRTPSLRYGFVHVLYRQALVHELPPSRRAGLSAALARALEAHSGDAPAAAFELACLYEAGRDPAQAARQLALAARNAAAVFAHQQAVGLARRGLRLLEALREGPERDALELPLQVSLGLQLQVTDGFAAAEVREAYGRARELCGRVGTAPLFAVLWGLWLYHKVRSELATARTMAAELRELAALQSDPALALQAHQALAVTTLCLGEPAATVRHMEQAAALYDPVRHRAHSSHFGQDPCVACKAFGAVALWLLGYPDQAVRVSNEAIQLARDLAQPSSLALALHFAAMLHQCRRDGPLARRCAEEALAVAGEHGFSFWLAGGTVLGGWALALCGDAEEGVARLRRGLRDWSATGSVTYQTYHLGLLADVLARQGQADEARLVLGEALQLARRTGEGLYEAELLRLSGELAGDAEQLRQALDLAGRQEARSLQLRAAASLARLDRDAGLPLLEVTYARFGEGFDTPDLREACALLG